MLPNPLQRYKGCFLWHQRILHFPCEEGIPREIPQRTTHRPSFLPRLLVPRLFDKPRDEDLQRDSEDIATAVGQQMAFDNVGLAALQAPTCSRWTCAERKNNQILNRAVEGATKTEAERRDGRCPLHQFFPSLVVYVKFSVCIRGEMQWGGTANPL